MTTTTLARYVQPVTHCNLPKLKMIILALWGPCHLCHIHSSTRFFLRERFIWSITRYQSFSSVSRYSVSFFEIPISFLWPFRTMQDIDSIARGGTGMGDNMNDMMKESIKQIKVLVLLPVFPVLHLRLSRTHIPSWVITIRTSVAVTDFLAYSTQ